MTNQAAFINVSPQEFLEFSDPPLLLDVRSQFEYATGHAPTAINLSLHRVLLGKIPGLRRWVLPQWFQALPKNEPIACICLSAHRSPIAAAELKKSGFQQVFNVTGGMLEWHRLGLETRSEK